MTVPTGLRYNDETIRRRTLHCGFKPARGTHMHISKDQPLIPANNAIALTPGVTPGDTPIALADVAVLLNAQDDVAIARIPLMMVPSRRRTPVRLASEAAARTSPPQWDIIIGSLLRPAGPPRAGARSRREAWARPRVRRAPQAARLVVARRRVSRRGPPAATRRSPRPASPRAPGRRPRARPPGLPGDGSRPS